MKHAFTRYALMAVVALFGFAIVTPVEAYQQRHHPRHDRQHAPVASKRFPFTNTWIVTGCSGGWGGYP